MKVQFTDQSGAEIFLSKIKERYPRYIRDQITVILHCLAKYAPEDTDKALGTCLEKALFSANDFKSILSSSVVIRENNNEMEIKSLGTPETQLMVNIRPNKSTIDVYQNLFKSN